MGWLFVWTRPLALPPLVPVLVQIAMARLPDAAAPTVMFCQARVVMPNKDAGAGVSVRMDSAVAFLKIAVVAVSVLVLASVGHGLCICRQTRSSRL